MSKIPSLLCNQILTTLKEAGKPLSVSQISRLTSISEKEVTVSIQHLMKQGRISSPKSSYFTVTDPSAIGRRV